MSRAVKSVFSVLVVILFQASFLEGVSGIKAGIEFPGYSFSERIFNLGIIRKKDNRIKTLRVGLFYNFRLTENFGIQTEIHYVKKGEEVKGSDDRKSVIEVTSLSYLELPFMFKLSIPSKRSRFYLLTGGYAAYRLKGRPDPSIIYQIFGIPENRNEFKGYRRFDFGLTFGAGINIEARPFSIMFETRYNHSLRSIYLTTFSTIRRRSISFTLGIGF